ncbi:hypothetical protein bsdtb5_00720 [Anaeromicropila herbilytica]|uniref:Uncharacterized protein n=2 Tax=Anaeromicropila herbilytica TaxID=2785025 RepID=A0A7R7IAT7_9FIRM|nr:hypothetical protein bsdtb5_00720 [Anaeromicropila herbilytica]
MGGRYFIQSESVEQKNAEESDPLLEDTDVEKYVRPSNLPVLNNKELPSGFLRDNFGKEYSEIIMPEELFDTTEDTILSYYSILREAANPVEDKSAGCGTIGNATLPYPVAYNFLSKEYQKQLPYKEYLKTFENILHLSVVKYRRIPIYEAPANTVRYFVEFETIEGTDKGSGSFSYYYAYVDVIKEGTGYKISNVDIYGENYLCAPMHGWAYDAEYVVQIEYGNWCSLVKELYPTDQSGYVKRIYFSGTDGKDYQFVFFQLTNDTDVLIAQYRRTDEDHWELIKIDPNKCLKDSSL